MSGPPRTLNKKQEQQLLRLYRGGATGPELGKQFGISAATVYRTIKLNGAKARTDKEIQSKRKIAFSDREAKAIAKRYQEEDVTVSSLAQEFEVGPKVIRRTLQEQGVVTLKGNRGGKRDFRITSVQEKVIAKRYEAGDAVDAIARTLGTSAATVHAWVRRLGLKRRYGDRSQHDVDETAFSELSPATCYWIGLLLADGSVTKNTNRVKLTVQESDAEILQAFKRFLSFTGRIEPDSQSKSVTLRFSSKVIRADLAAYGVVPDKTYSCAAPSELLASRDFWRGVIDGDGGWTLTVDRHGRTFAVMTLTGYSGIPLLEQFSEYAASVDGVKKKHPRKRPEQQETSDLRYNGREAALMAKHLYRRGDIAIARKRKKAREIVRIFLS